MEFNFKKALLRITLMLAVQRKKIGLSRKGAKSREALFRLVENEASSVEFIRASFLRKECVRFSRENGGEGSRCRCGRRAKEHRGDLDK